MRLPKSHTLEKVAALINCTFVGDPDHEITGINEIHKVEAGDIVFVDHPKYYDKALNSAATTILINKEVACPKGKGLLISDDPWRDFNFLTRKFSPYIPQDGDRGKGYVQGEGTTIDVNVTIGNGVTIGKNCLIRSGVVIYDNVTIGDDVIIHANAVIGADAFYYQKRGGRYEKMHTCGSVRIADDVEIGAHCTIDRGVTGETVIGKGCRLDNHVHIGHDTVIGERCLFAAQVGIAGCVVVEDDVTLWGQVGVPSDLTIGKGAIVLGQSGLMGSIEGGKTYFGSPVGEAREKFRELAMIRKLPEIIGKLK